MMFLHTMPALGFYDNTFPQRWIGKASGLNIYRFIILRVCEAKSEHQNNSNYLKLETAIREAAESFT